MAKRTVTPQQIVTALRRIELALAQGAAARMAIRHAGISSAAYYRWRGEYGGMNAEQVQRVMELKKDNARLQDVLEKLSRVVVWDPGLSPAAMGAGGDRRAAGAERRRRPKSAKA
jgi:hypothetical protein